MQSITPLLSSATRHNMQRLIVFRNVVITCLVLLVIGLSYTTIQLESTPLFFSITGLGLLNAFAWWRLRHTQQTSEYELLIQLFGDVAVYSIIFYFSGGYSNPIIWIYLLPITIAAVALRTQFAWLIAGLSIACYTFLIFYNVPVSALQMQMNMNEHDGMQGSMQDNTHLIGMWLGFVISSILIAIFITRIGQNLRDYDKKLTDIREKALESEHMLELGALATNAAHEIGTPLATMAVITKELTLDLAEQPSVIKQLEILRTQISRCKEILSSITFKAGQARADSGNGIRLRDFLESSIQRWRDTRPATELVLDLSTNTFNPIIKLDRALTQAIQNVLDNAADESPERVLFNANWDHEALSIVIRDFGSGLSKDMLGQVGKPFHSSKKNEGMGLGVYLTQISLARYDGELSLNNHPEKGVITAIKLPLKKLLLTKPLEIS
jgi:two-component system, sensor histidine kinase RegB